MTIGQTLFPTTIAGSLPKPAWLAAPEKLWAPWRLEGEELAAAKDDATLLVLRADGPSISLLEPTLTILEDRPVFAVVNAYDPARTLQADLMAALFERLGEKLSPYPIHRDEAIPEAFARRMSPEDHAAHAQVIHDLHGLLRWIQRQCRPMTEPRSGTNVY